MHSHNYFLARAESRMIEGDIAGAISDLTCGLELDPKNDTARCNLAGLLAGIGKYEEAIVEYEKVDVGDICKWVEVKYNEIQVLKSAGKRGACLVLVSRWLSKVEQLLKDCLADDEGFLLLNEKERLNLDYLARRYGKVLDIQMGLS